MTAGAISIIIPDHDDEAVIARISRFAGVPVQIAARPRLAVSQKAE